MKKILISVLLICFAFVAESQTFNYNPSLNQTQNLPSAPSQGFALDARSYVYDSIQYTYRPFVSTAEVLTYLSNHKYRYGNFPIIVNTGGTLSGGLITGGVNTAYWFQNGLEDSNLVVMIPPSTSCTGCLINTNNLSDVSNAAAARTNLGLQNMAQQTTAAGGDLSGFWPSPTVVQFNGLPPSYYLNYNNLSNKPSIPSQFNPIAGSNIALSGTYPNITFSATGLPNTAGVYIKFTSGGNVINLDTANYRKVDTLYGVNDSTLDYTLNGNLYSIQLKGGTHGGGGGGSGTVTNFSFVNANGISGTVTNPTSIPALTLSLGNITPSTVNGLTLAALTSGFSISGGTTPYTLTVDSTATIKGNNSGDVTLSGQNYLSLSGQAITANAVDVSGSNITGILKAASFPALTGQVTTSAGSLATTIATNTVTYSNLQQLPAKSLFGNPTSSLANSQATYVGYGMLFNVDTIKVDTSTLKTHFAWGGLTSVTATGGNPMFSTTATWSAQTVGLTFSLLNASGNTFWGNSSGSSGAPAYMSAATATSILTQFSSSAQGVVPSTGGLNSSYFLNASGTWTIPSGGSGADTNYIVSLGGGLYPIRGSADTFYVKTDSAGYGMLLAYSADSAIYFAVDTSKIATQYDVGTKFTLPSLTQYSVPIATGTTLTQDNSNFYYNYSTHIFSVGTNGDFTGTNPINIYGQYDAYEPHSAISSVTNALTTPGITASTSRGTGGSPAIDSIGDIIGAHSFWAYTGSSPAYAFMAGMVGTVQGSTLSNLGGQLDFYVKADNGSPATQLTIKNTGVLQIEHYTTNGGLLYTDGSGNIVQGGAPAHAGMRPYWNGSAVSWTDTTANSGGGGGSSTDTVISVPNTSNYTIPTTTKNIYLLLADLTGQANRNLVLPTGTSGQHITVKNRNTLASGFTWTFTNVTVHDFSDNAITTLQNVTVYQLIFDGTYYDITN